MNIRDFIAKLQNLSDAQKRIILWAVVIVLAVIMGIFWFKSTMERFQKMENPINNMELPALNTTELDNAKNKITDTFASQTADWQIYKNEEYKFEIKYPVDWSKREYISGVAFFPKTDEVKNTTGNGSINIGFYKRGASYCNIAFEDYVKIAAPSEIQNFESLNSSEGGISYGGIELYKTMWNYSDMKGNKKVSLPITYFKTDDKLCGTIEAFLNDSGYSEVYEKMIYTFNFTTQE